MNMIVRDETTGRVLTPIERENPYDERGRIQWSDKWKWKARTARAKLLGIETLEDVPMTSGMQVEGLGSQGLNVDQIEIDFAYQRKSHHQTIFDQVVEHGFNYMAAGAIDVVLRSSGTYVTWDGGHRLNMALLAGVETMPASVVTGVSLADEANAFVIRNNENRRAKTSNVIKAGIVGENQEMLDIEESLRIANIWDPEVTPYDPVRNPSRLGIGQRVASSSYRTAMKWGSVDEEEYPLGNVSRVERLYLTQAGKLVTSIWPGEDIPRNMLDGLTKMMQVYTVTSQGGGVDLGVLSRALQYLKHNGPVKLNNNIDPPASGVYSLADIYAHMNPEVSTTRVAKDAAYWLVVNAYNPQARREDPESIKNNKAARGKLNEKKLRA